MTAILRYYRGRPPRSVCRHCHEAIVSIDEVGWLDPDGRHTYDICPLDRFGNHAPDVLTAEESELRSLLEPRS
ncbi:hypothetical protein [Nocardioides sp. cx-173]|uniref:hypothetical protein n=1 Tax=Nocardioides sp. cx-173 TaxID=2898796 RepID=UPI001E406906|nr:hypothetical protein [Nocardioides sp. cx-173]MCD4523919.1 hypothetical protein [Nocardioides sp. cx-173]UGB41764.1 hypothetical protein LQ940_20735 [Nocardioides sp. cx-173]